MPQRKALTTILLAAPLVLATLGCGGMSNSSNRILQSITVSPSVADAHSSNGSVQFTATGTFSQAPSPATCNLRRALLGQLGSRSRCCNPGGTGMGTATFQCVAGASGKTTIQAIASTNSAPGGAMSTAVTGTATLTCP